MLVTGASQGIGRALAEAFAEAGAEVLIAARREDVLAEVAASLPGGARVCRLDLADRNSIDDLVAELDGGVDVLVNCGGIYGAGTMSASAPGALDSSARTVAPFGPP